MNLLSIFVEDDIESLQKKIEKQIEFFKIDEILIEEEMTYLNQLYQLNYRVKIDSIKNYPINDFVNLFKYCVANAVFEYFELHLHPELVRTLIGYQYYYFNPKERLEIQKKTFQIIRSDETALEIKKEGSTNKEKIIKEILNFFRDYSEINLRGFITFRLKEYILYLEDTIERAVEDFLIEKQYNEFIRLLQYFVDIQDAKIDTIHIMIDQENKYRLYDDNNALINNDYLKEIATEMMDNDLNYEDILISSLITIAPNKIYIHNISAITNVEIIKTIYKVFASKVEICDGCNLCTVKVRAEKE